MSTFREHFLRKNLFPGLNAVEQTYGKVQQEIEYTIYAELYDLAPLKQAFHVEEHEQWRIPLGIDANIRARVRAINGREWQLTTKESSDEWVGDRERNTLITKDDFETWKKVGCDGFMKTRHSFRCEGSDLIWEVDVFKDRLTGQSHLWVKMDMEVKDLDQEIPKPPFKVKEFILGDRDGAPLSERVKIRSLWENQWARLDGKDDD